MTGDRNSTSDLGDDDSTLNRRTRPGAGKPIGLVVGLGAAAATLAARRHLRRGAATVARLAADTLETSTDLVERSVREAGRVALLPADATLALARDRVLAGLPEAADTKWRVTQLLFRSTVVTQVAQGEAAGPDLNEAGAVYAAASQPEDGWDEVTLRETLRRVTHALDMEGTIARRDASIEVVTTGCALVDGAAVDQRPGVCDAVCGENASLFHGIASAAGATFESPQRMGHGADHCLRRVTLTGGNTAPPPDATID